MHKWQASSSDPTAQLQRATGHESKFPQRRRHAYWTLNQQSFSSGRPEKDCNSSAFASSATCKAHGSNKESFNCIVSLLCFTGPALQLLYTARRQEQQVYGGLMC